LAGKIVKNIGLSLITAVFIFGENIPPLRITGLVVICFGLFIVAKAG
jgi:multidrug transporter EmrE-like cation transporter